MATSPGGGGLFNLQAKRAHAPTNPNLILEEVPEAERLQNWKPNEDEEDALTPEDGQDNGLSFTQQMRAVTKSIHNLSDALVNAKLGLAMSDDRVWAEGLLIFYEIFKFLESALVRLRSKSEHFHRVNQIIEGVERTRAFEADLDFYYKPQDWRGFETRPSVAEYLKHLAILEKREPLRLLAYVYHLYMGLLSGGQILKRKRDLRNRFKQNVCGVFQWFGLQSSGGGGMPQGQTVGVGLPKPGDAVTFFGDGRSIGDIKKEIAFTMNDLALDMSRDEKNSLLEESIEVFKLNNEIVNSIKRTGIIALQNYATCLIVFVSVVSAICFYYYRSSSVDSVTE